MVRVTSSHNLKIMQAAKVARAERFLDEDLFSCFYKGFSFGSRFAAGADSPSDDEEMFYIENTSNSWAEALRAGFEFGSKLKPCRRCGGTGNVPRHSNVLNGVCFGCSGHGF